MTQARERDVGFPPLAAGEPRLLLLGSMPSVQSLARQEYYGNPQNSFWRLMGELFAAGPELAYRERVARLTAAGVAVWDVVAAAHRPGSLDSAIEMSSVEVNDFGAFFARYPTVRQVFFNGRKAENMYRQRVLPDLPAQQRALLCTTLPSSSPAMATLNFAGKLERWRCVGAAARAG